MLGVRVRVVIRVRVRVRVRVRIRVRVTVTVHAPHCRPPAGPSASHQVRRSAC